MQSITRTTLIIATAFVATLAPAAAAAAQAPATSTTGASSVTSSGARLAGTVNPRGQATTYYFEYGTTRSYGSRTPVRPAGSGTIARRVTATVGGLAPRTRYHFRLVAGNATGVNSGVNRSFRTRFRLQIAATRNPVTFGSASAITGRLDGNGNAGRQVALQQRQFPYTGAWATVGNPLTTQADGTFSFPALLLPQTSQFRVQTTEGSTVRSPVLTLGVAVRVKTNVSATRVTRGRSIRFSGTIRPVCGGV
jgi:hypothetical protein